MDPNLLVTLIYFLSIGAVAAGTAIYFYIMALVKEPEVLLMERMTTQKEVQYLIDNLSSQFQNFMWLPLRWGSMKPYHAHHTSSWIFIATTVASLVVLGASLAMNLAQVIRISTFCYIASLNALFMIRQHLYYVRRTHLTYDAAHYLVLDTTQFQSFDICAFNIIQIGILILEFLQLLSFPVRDLLQSIDIARNASNDNSDSSTADFIVGVLTLFADFGSRFYKIQFWFLVAVIACIVIVIAAVHTYNWWRPQQPIALYWVKYLLPMANLFYLPMLVMLIGSASCLSKLGTEESSESARGLLRCNDPSISKPLYLGFTVAAYTTAYIILTTFVTSFDRIPIRGEIHYRSQGVAFLKNMSMLLSIDFLLVASSYRHIRSVLSLIIVIAMACFNIRTHPCFVDPINFWRTYGFCCILWVALIVTMITNENNTLTRFGIGGIAAAMAIGVAVLFVVFIAVRYISQCHSRHANTGGGSRSEERDELVADKGQTTEAGSSPSRAPQHLSTPSPAYAGI
ncbi:hypothetical protein GGI12_000099 [Dipsacomyces acuminosporus]|nr:hypothetical protein GGI12_000099 [Dipsacomyces acuminosporus]